MSEVQYCGSGVPGSTVKAERTQSEFEKAQERIGAAFNNLSNSMDRLCCKFEPVLRQIPPPNKSVEGVHSAQSISLFDDFIDMIEARINDFSEGLMSLCERSAV